MEFDINSYQGNVVMCCRSAEEVSRFAKFLNDSGRRWSSNQDYKEEAGIYSSCSEDNGFCFAFNEGRWDRESYFIHDEETWQILHFNDFSWDKVDADSTTCFEKSSEIDDFLNQYIS